MGSDARREAGEARPLEVATQGTIELQIDDSHAQFSAQDFHSAAVRTAVVVVPVPAHRRRARRVRQIALVVSPAARLLREPEKRNISTQQL